MEMGVLPMARHRWRGRRFMSGSTTRLGSGRHGGTVFIGTGSSKTLEVSQWWHDELGAALVLAVLTPNRIISKHMNANCSSFQLRVFLGLSIPRAETD
jgi:hypothetical protein